MKPPWPFFFFITLEGAWGNMTIKYFLLLNWDCCSGMKKEKGKRYLWSHLHKFHKYTKYQELQIFGNVFHKFKKVTLSSSSIFFPFFFQPWAIISVKGRNYFMVIFPHAPFTVIEKKEDFGGFIFQRLQFSRNESLGDIPVLGPIPFTPHISRTYHDVLSFFNY